MNITVDVTFPDDAPAAASQNAPVIIVNGVPKKVNVAVVNYEEETIGVQFLGGSLWDLETGGNVRNLTQQVLAVELPKGQKADLPYTVLVDMHPKDLRLNLQMVLRSGEQRLATATAYNSTVSIVEQPMSLLDPQLYVYNTRRTPKAYLSLHSFTDFITFRLDYSFTSSSFPVSLELATGLTTTGSTPSTPRGSVAPAQ